MPASPEKETSLGRTFNRIFSGAMFSKFADGLSGAAIPLLAAKLTRDPVLISIQSNMFLLPWLFFAIPLGALVDRLNRRTAMLLVQLTRVLIGMTIASLIINNQMSLWALMLLTFIFGFSEVVYDTATQSSIPSLLKGHQLEKGNSRLQLADTVMQQFVGVPLGAMLYAAAVFSPFAGISVCYIVTMVLVYGIGKDDLQANNKTRENRKLSAEIREGLVYLFREKVLFRLVMTTGIIGFFYAMGQATLVLFLLDRLKVPEVVYGWVMIPLAIGALFGAFASPRISARFGRSRVLALALCVSSGSLLVAGLSPNIYWYMTASMIHGFFIAQWNILLMSTYHVMIPNEIFGRIHGTRRTIVWGLMPIGGYIGGLLAKIDLSVPMIAGGALAAVVALSQFKFIRAIQS